MTSVLNQRHLNQSRKNKSPLMQEFGNKGKNFNGTLTPQKPTINPLFLPNNRNSLKRTQKIFNNRRNSILTTKSFQNGISDYDLGQLTRLNKFQLFGIVRPEVINRLLKKIGRNEFKRVYGMSNQEFTDAMNSLKGVGLEVDDNTLRKFGREERLRELGIGGQRKEGGRFGGLGDRKVSAVSAMSTMTIDDMRCVDNPLMATRDRRKSMMVQRNFSPKKNKKGYSHMRRNSYAPQSISNQLYLKAKRLSMTPKITQEAKIRAPKSNKSILNKKLEFGSPASFVVSRKLGDNLSDSKQKIYKKLDEEDNEYFNKTSKMRSRSASKSRSPSPVRSRARNMSPEYTVFKTNLLKTPLKDKLDVKRRLFDKENTPDRPSAKKRPKKNRYARQSASKLNLNSSILGKFRFKNGSRGKSQLRVPKLKLDHLSTEKAKKKVGVAKKNPLQKKIGKSLKKPELKLPRRSSHTSINSRVSLNNPILYIKPDELINVSNFDYEPDNTPTKQTFLRNTFNEGKGGSNALQLNGEEDKSKIYYVLPKDFYARRYAKNKDIDENGNRMRHYSPDYRGSLLEGAIEQSDKKEFISRSPSRSPISYTKSPISAFKSSAVSFRNQNFGNNRLAYG